MLLCEMASKQIAAFIKGGFQQFLGGKKTIRSWVVFGSLHKVGRITNDIYWMTIYRQISEGCCKVSDVSEFQNLWLGLLQPGLHFPLDHGSCDIPSGHRGSAEWEVGGAQGGTSSKSGWWFRTLFIFHNIWDVILPID